MSNSSNVPTPPAGWLDELSPLKSTHVRNTLDALGEEPRGWRSAAEAARLAEWRVRASYPEMFTPTLTAKRNQAEIALAEAQARAAAKPGSTELRNHVVSCQNRLQVAQDMLDAAPTETERVKVSAEREERKRVLSRMQDERRLFELRGLPVPAETLEGVVNLIEEVDRDERQNEADREGCQKLQKEFEGLRTKALSLLSGALDREIVDCADAVKALLNPRQLAIAREYPTMSDPRVTAAWKRAMGLARIALDLNGTGIDVDATFGQALNEKQYLAFNAIVWASVRKMVKPRVAQ